MRSSRCTGISARGDAPELDPDHLIHEGSLPDVRERCGALEARMRAHDDVRPGRGLEKRERTAGPRRQHTRQQAGVRKHPRVVLLLETLERPSSFALREPGPFRIDQHAIMRTETLRELPHAADLLLGIAGGAVDKHVGEAVPHDVEAGVREQLTLEDVPEPHGMRPAHERGREQRVAGTRVPEEEEVRPAPEIRIAVDLEPEPEKPLDGPEQRRAPPRLEAEVNVRPALGVDTDGTPPHPQPGARSDAHDLTGQVDGHERRAPERDTRRAPHEIDQDGQRDPQGRRADPHTPGDGIGRDRDESALRGRRFSHRHTLANLVIEAMPRLPRNITSPPASLDQLRLQRFVERLRPEPDGEDGSSEVGALDQAEPLPVQGELRPEAGKVRQRVAVARTHITVQSVQPGDPGLERVERPRVDVRGDPDIRGVGETAGRDRIEVLDLETCRHIVEQPIDVEPRTEIQGCDVGLDEDPVAQQADVHERELGVADLHTVAELHAPNLRRLGRRCPRDERDQG